MRKYSEEDYATRHWFFKYCLNVNECSYNGQIMYMYLFKYFKEFLFASMINNEEKNNALIKELLLESNISYNQILEKFKILLQELKLKNSLEISLLYSYLLWNGYFSKDKTLSYKVEDRLCIPGCHAYDVMRGKVVCLNISDMLKDILNKCEYSSSVLLNKTDSTKNIKKDYVPDIYRKKQKIKLRTKISSTFLDIISSSKGNHAFTLIKEKNNMLYIYDATNLLYLELDKINSAKIMCGEGRFELKPSLSYIVNDSSSRKALDSLNTTLEFSSPYSRKDYIITSENCMDVFKKNIHLLDDYHDEIKKNINKIEQETNCFVKYKSKMFK